MSGGNDTQLNKVVDKVAALPRYHTPWSIGKTATATTGPHLERQHLCLIVEDQAFDH